MHLLPVYLSGILPSITTRLTSSIPNFPEIASNNPLLVVSTSTSNSQNKVDNDSREKGYCQHCRTEPIVETTLSSHPDALRSPVKCDEGVNHGSHCDESKETSRDLTDFVTEVEETDSETTENDREVEP